MFQRNFVALPGIELVILSRASVKIPHQIRRLFRRWSNAVSTLIRRWSDATCKKLSSYTTNDDFQFSSYKEGYKEEFPEIA